MGQKVARGGLLVALAFVFGYLESLVPISVGIPGIKLGIQSGRAFCTLQSRYSHRYYRVVGTRRFRRVHLWHTHDDSI